jgi:hypothetical protein
MLQRLWLSPRAQRIAERFDGDAAKGVRTLARQLLADSRISGPPFFPDLLAQHCGISEIRPMDIRQDGLLVNDGTAWTIYVNQRYPVRSGQWNAICAHELGHALLLRHGNGERRAVAWTREEEELCDLAARELLLPLRAIHPMLIDGGPDEAFTIESLKWFVDTFRTPPRMTAARLVESGPWRGLAAQWTPRAGGLGGVRLAWWYGDPPPALAPLRRGLAPAELFGKTNRIDHAWNTDMPTLGLEALHGRKGWVFVRSGPFEENGARYVISLVRFE